MKSALIWLVLAYRRRISPYLPDSCKYYPSCSAYSLKALERHGAFKGGLLTLWRLLRCNPLSGGGFDPVPPVGRWRAGEKELASIKR